MCRVNVYNALDNPGDQWGVHSCISGGTWSCDCSIWAEFSFTCDLLQDWLPLPLAHLCSYEFHATAAKPAAVNGAALGQPGYVCTCGCTSDCSGTSCSEGLIASYKDVGYHQESKVRKEKKLIMILCDSCFPVVLPSVMWDKYLF